MYRRIYTMGLLLASKQDLRRVRTRFGMQELVQIHHVIPRFCARHPTVRALDFDLEGSSANFVLMPTRRGVRELRLRSDRLVHDGGHMAYCAFVWERLDAVRTDEELQALLMFLHRGMRRANDEIPWR